MELAGDDRAQSIQIGAVLLFGVLIIAFSSYQAVVVPDQNRGVEFNHNQGVQSDMQDLRNAIVSVPGSTSTQAISIGLSPRYPSRLVARNPGPASGSLRTNGTSSMRYNITVRNAAADGETEDIWNGTARSYNTGTIAYSPNYNVYANPPTTYYGQSVVYNQFPTANLTISDQAMVDGRDITLVALNGSLSRTASDTVSVDIQPVSRSDDPIIVRNDTASTNVSISVPTRLPQSVWEELLEEEIDDNPGNLDNDSYVANVTATDGPGPYYNLTITFEQTPKGYRLRMAKAGVGTGVTNESAAYLTGVTDSTSVTRGSSTDIVLEVRDEYNNPVQGVSVRGGVDPNSEGALAQSTRVSDNDGQVTFDYQTSQTTSTGTQQLNFSYIGLDSTFNETTPQNATLSVTVTTQSGGGGGGGGGGGAAGGSVYYNAVTQQIEAIDTDGITQYTGPSVEAKGLSRLVDIDSDSDTDIVFVDSNGDLASTDTRVPIQIYDDSGNVNQNTNIGVGDWDGDSTTEVVYVRNGDIYDYEPATGNRRHIQKNSNAGGSGFVQASAIAGIGDFDSGSTGLEIVFVSGRNSKLSYISLPGESVMQVNAEPNSAAAVSQPSDFDGDGTIEIAYATGNGDMQLVDSGGTDRSTVGSNVAEVPLGAVDWDSDGIPEIVYANSNDNNNLYYYDYIDSTSTTITDSNRDKISTTSDAGTS